MIGLLCVTAALQPEMDDCMVMGRMAAAAIGYGWLCLDLALQTGLCMVREASIAMCCVQ
jgi:hypothetical protein